MGEEKANNVVNDNLYIDLQHELRNNYKAYIPKNGLSKHCSSFIIETLEGNHFHLHYMQLYSRLVEFLKDSETGQSFIKFDLFTSNIAVSLFLFNFSREEFIKFEDDFLNQNIYRIFEYSGNINRTDKPIIRVKHLHSASHPVGANSLPDFSS